MPLVHNQYQSACQRWHLGFDLSGDPFYFKILSQLRVSILLHGQGTGSIDPQMMVHLISIMHVQAFAGWCQQV